MFISRVVCCAVLLACLTCLLVSVQAQTKIPRVAILDLGDSILGRTAADKLAANLRAYEAVVLDRDQSRAAASGIGYRNSLNLTRQDARELGSALGSEFYIVGDAQNLRRSRSDGPAYFESYAALFLVSVRTGKLIHWTMPSFEASNREEAERLLLASLAGHEVIHPVRLAMRRALDDEVRQGEVVAETASGIVEAFEDQQSEQVGLQLPRPFRRLHPKYPTTAARADAEATVDVLADIDSGGKVIRVEITRWAGFGLDEATAETVRRLEFFPALQDGKPIPIRVLLRYNFRKPGRPNGENER